MTLGPQLSVFCGVQAFRDIVRNGKVSEKNRNSEDKDNGTEQRKRIRGKRKGKKKTIEKTIERSRLKKRDGKEGEFYGKKNRTEQKGHEERP